MKRILALMVLATLTFSLLASCTKSENPLSSAEFLDLGEKYLLEMDYEQAVVQFLKVIEIEPMNPRGYTGLAEAYVGLGDIENAINVLKQGLAALPNEQTIIMILDELVNKQEQENLAMEELLREQERRAELLLEAEALLSDFAALISIGNPDAVAERMLKDGDVRKVLDELMEFNGLPYIVNTEHGKIGTYQATGLGESQIFCIYHGGYSGDSREGDGTWITENSVAVGNWSADAPNGYFEQRGNLSSPIQPWTTVGNVVNGLWDGERVTDHGNGSITIMQFDKGYVIPYTNFDVEQVIIGITPDGDRNLGASEDDLNKLWGIRGFGEKQWG